MTDREMLEFAAKAAGIEIIRSRLDDPLWRDMLLVDRKHGQGVGWNPLTDDGDALRLAVKLAIDIGKAQLDYFDKSSTDPCAATRRAIVHAAAQVGRRSDDEHRRARS